MKNGQTQLSSCHISFACMRERSSVCLNVALHSLCWSPLVTTATLTTAGVGWHKLKHNETQKSSNHLNCISLVKNYIFIAQWSTTTRHDWSLMDANIGVLWTTGLHLEALNRPTQTDSDISKPVSKFIELTNSTQIMCVNDLKPIFFCWVPLSQLWLF